MVVRKRNVVVDVPPDPLVRHVQLVQMAEADTLSNVHQFVQAERLSRPANIHPTEKDAQVDRARSSTLRSFHRDLVEVEYDHRTSESRSRFERVVARQPPRAEMLLLVLLSRVRLPSSDQRRR